MWRCHDTSCQAAHIFSNYQQLCVWQSWIFKYIACCKISYRYEVRNGLSGRYQQQRCNVVTRGPKTVFHTTFLTHFLLLVCFYAPWKHPRTYSFLILSEGIEKDQWHEWIGYRDQSAVYWAYIICSCLSCLFILLQIAHLWKHLQNYQVKPFLKFDLIRWKKTISFKLFFYLFINMHESPKIILLLTFSEQLKITHNRYFYKSFKSGQLILKAF